MKKNAADLRPVCFVSANLGQGGAQRAMINMANYWASQGRATRIVTLDEGEPAAGYRVREEVRIFSLGISDRTDRGLLNPLNLWRFSKLRDLLLRDPREAIIPMMEKVAVVTLASTFPAQRLILASERIDPAHFDVGPLWSGLRRITYPRATRVVVQTSGAARFFDGWLSRKPVVIPNPVLPPPFDPDPTDIRPRVIAAAGRLDPQKGFSILLKAFRKSGLVDKGWTLRIAGEGPLHDQLKNETATLGLENSVRFEGWISDMPAFYARARIFVLPSLFEGFPNALCEAMACGCAVISSDCPSGPNDILRDGANGLLVPPGDPLMLAAALARLASQPELARRVAEAAKQVVQRYSSGKIMREWESLIDG